MLLINRSSELQGLEVGRGGVNLFRRRRSKLVSAGQGPSHLEYILPEHNIEGLM